MYRGRSGKDIWQSCKMPQNNTKTGAENAFAECGITWGMKGREMKQKQMINWKNLTIYLFFVVGIILTISQKKSLHIDEVFSYGLANNVYSGSISMSVQDGMTYADAGTPWLQYMTAEEGYCFDYANVWVNQENDVHPPLYYMLIHTICSLFPGEYSIWYTGIVNIVFAALTLLMLRKLLYVLTDDTFLVNAVSVFFVCSSCILDTTAFLRMYVMTLFLVTAITYLFIKHINEKYSAKFWIIAGLISVVGALTHYYFIVYLFYLCLVMGIYFLVSKKWKEAISLVVSMAAAGGLSLLIFPSMYEHMFGSGQRGQQSVENFKESSFADFWSRIKSFYGFLNEQIFGGMLTYVIVMFGFGMTIHWLTSKHAKQGKKNQESTVQKARWALLLLPGLFYFITVSKIAVYITERYQQPIYAVVIAGIVALLYVGIKKMAGTQGQFILVLVLVVMTVNSWKTAPWGNLQKASEPILQVAEENASLDCIYVYDSRWKMQPSFYDVQKYNSVTFFKEKNLGMLNDSECRNNAEFILYVTNSCNHQSVIDNVTASCPNINGYEKLGDWGYVTVYRFYGNV